MNQQNAPNPGPLPLLIKICGITRLEDGLVALEAGADWLGFIRWPRSARYLPLDLLTELIDNLKSRAPRPFEAVGGYVNETRETIEREAAQAGLSRIQLHGDETLSFARALSRPALKALRIRDAGSVRAADDFEGLDLLADAFDPALPGGTGLCYDYAMLRDLTARRRVLIAGGLTAETVGGVIRALRPWGVDVSSGVESAPGVKDPVKVREFINAARQAAKEQ